MQRRQLLTLAGLSGCALPLAVQARPVVRVAAASDLKFVLTRLIAIFYEQTGLHVEASFGSSGNFARQIRQGLPVDLFMSADEAWVIELAQLGLTRRGTDGQADQGVLYGQGQLALMLPRGSRISMDAELRGLRQQADTIRKFAIANPEHAPYGRAAREALQQLGQWDWIASKLVLGESVAQVTQFVASGAAQAGIGALSLAMAPELGTQTPYLALPTRLHAPLRQRMVLTRQAGREALDFYAFLQSTTARQMFQTYGLGL